MSDWTLWLMAAGTLVILELFTGTFYLLMIAMGLAVGALAALAGGGMTLQIVASAVASVVAIGALQARRKRHPGSLGGPRGTDPQRDPDINLDIGQQVSVDSWSGTQARVMHRGAAWDAELAPGAEARRGDYRIVAVKGSRLVLSNA